MNRSLSIVRANSNILKFSLFVFILAVALQGVLDTVFNMSGINDTIGISFANVITIFLLVVPLILPLYFFRRLLSLGASRRDYMKGIIWTYVFYSIIFSLFNILWFLFENNYLNPSVREYFNIMALFNWDRSGVVGMFLYQFFSYLLVISFINLLVSCYKHVLGIGLYIALSIIIPVSMAIGTLREGVGIGLSYLLFNPSIVMQIVLSSIVTIILFYCSWWFIKRREL
ncbi:hypothetical protein [Chengkuizengella sediminis]|uniref:hypothetical protein n=1 Tax=Chengkuizengella sediminis TaxID=1885917 RepID=UPI0013897F02|nr:hypothetical protein [Chengkuizengella sediminis]NDI35236.1 hypothetical protein [Chengkuizengella sediminis]